MLAILGLSLLTILTLTGCGGDGDGPRQSPSGPTTSTVEIPDSAPSAPCAGPTIVLQNGTTIVVSGSPGSTVTAGNVTINFNQTCNFTTTTNPAPGPSG